MSTTTRARATDASGTKPPTTTASTTAGPRTTGPRSKRHGVLASASRALDRPLTSYHLVLGVTALLTVLGLVMVLSASSVLSYRETHNSYAIFTRQAVWVAIGLPLMWLASRLPPWAFRKLAYPSMILAIILLVLVQVPSLGSSVNGNQNWIDFGGPFKLQPSEFAKVALVLWGADLLARKERLLTQWRHLLVPLLPGGAMLAALIMLGHDLGTTMILLAILLALLWVAGTPMRLFFGAGLAVAAFFAYFVSGNEERLSRITGFMNPVADIQNGGFQAGHGFYALSSGGWWGVGLGASRQKWGTLPEAHTDFIFAVIGEELGLVGTLAVVILFGILAYAGLRIAMRATDLFTRLAAAGITGWVAVQGIVNIGAVIGLLPITGIPLPLVSYGGAAVLNTLFSLGMLLAFARREPGAAEALAARRRGSLLHVFLPTRSHPARPPVAAPAAARSRAGGRPGAPRQ